MLRQQTTATDATIGTAAHPDTMVASSQPTSGAKTHRGRAGLWIAGVAAAILIAATAVLVWQVSDGSATVDSFDVAEGVRMQQLTAGATGPVDDSFVAAEETRMTGLAPTTDASSATAEQTRMTGLAPATDNSYQTAEEIRMSGLAP